MNIKIFKSKSHRNHKDCSTGTRGPFASGRATKSGQDKQALGVTVLLSSDKKTNLSKKVVGL